MKFEYELKYDFITEELNFRITKMPESLRNGKDIKLFCIDGENWYVKSYNYPQISTNFNKIYLRGYNTENDNDLTVEFVVAERAITIAKVLKEFQHWVEYEYEVNPVEMTVAEIEKKLGISNLKIVKEDK